MARKRVKKRTHVGANNPATVSDNHGSKDPKSMVIRIGAGEVGSSVSQLAADFRKVMEPGTAARLKERRANRLKDYVVMTGPLGVTHLMLFSRSESGNTNLRVALTPRGPTLNFRVEKYSLCKDVQRAQRRPKGSGKEQLAPPLLVMNNFHTPDADATSKVPKHLESLVTSVWSSVFPPLNPNATPLSKIKRTLLLNREKDPENDGSFIINLRHYAITTRSTGISRPLRRLEKAEKLLASKTNGKGGIPNLGKLEDIADFLQGGENGDGYLTDATSGSEIDSDAEVEVKEQKAQKIKKSAAPIDDEAADEDDAVEKRAVKLVELGPRMRLRLTKVEEGLCTGKVMWHEYIHKTKEEVKELEKRWEKRQQEKEARKKEQKENIEKKRKAKAEKGEVAGDDSDVEMDDYDDEFDSEGLEGDAEYKVNEGMEDTGEWEDEEDEIANG